MRANREVYTKCHTVSCPHVEIVGTGRISHMMRRGPDVAQQEEVFSGAPASVRLSSPPIGLASSRSPPEDPGSRRERPAARADAGAARAACAARAARAAWAARDGEVRP